VFCKSPLTSGPPKTRNSQTGRFTMTHKSDIRC
jgi:hypothetical protein